MMKTLDATEKVTSLVKRLIRHKPANPNLMSTCEGWGIGNNFKILKKITTELLN